MALPRTFVGFSSTDIGRYRMMCAWKANEHIDFDFVDFQLNDAINSTNEQYVKGLIRRKIVRSDTYALLIGNDTFKKTTYVKWEVAVAIEQGCRLIGVNLNYSRFKNALCPYFFEDKGAVHVAYSPHILAHALKHWQRQTPAPGTPDDWYFDDATYTRLGYQLVNDTAVWPEPTNPFAGGNRPPWAK